MPKAGTRTPLVCMVSFHIFSFFSLFSFALFRKFVRGGPLSVAGNENPQFACFHVDFGRSNRAALLHVRYAFRDFQAGLGVSTLHVS